MEVYMSCRYINDDRVSVSLSFGEYVYIYIYTCVCVVIEYLQRLCGPGHRVTREVRFGMYEVVCVCAMVVCGHGTPTEARHTYCESSTAHMWKAWGHTRSKPQIIRMRKDLCLLRVSPSRSDMPRLPSHVHKCNYHHSTPHQPIPTTPPTEPETAERTTRDSNTTARTVLPSWHGTGNEQPRRRLICASAAAVVYIVLQTVCNSLGGEPNEPSPVAKQCTPG